MGRVLRSHLQGRADAHFAQIKDKERVEIAFKFVHAALMKKLSEACDREAAKRGQRSLALKRDVAEDAAEKLWKKTRTHRRRSQERA